MANTFKNIRKKLRRKRLLAEKKHLEKAQAGKTGSSASRKRKIKAVIRKQKKVLRPLAVAMAVAILGGLIFIFLQNRSYSDYKIVTTSEREDTVSTQYVELAGKILRFSSDEVSVVNSKLETIWSESYDMQNSGS